MVLLLLCCCLSFGFDFCSSGDLINQYMGLDKQKGGLDKIVNKTT